MELTINDNGSVEKLLNLLPDVIGTIKSIAEENRFMAEWYDLEACFNLRGAGHFSTFRNNRYYQPKGGIPDAMVQGRKVWNRSTVMEWIKLTDADLESYNEKYLTGAKK